MLSLPEIKGILSIFAISKQASTDLSKSAKDSLSGNGQIKLSIKAAFFKSAPIATKLETASVIAQTLPQYGSIVFSCGFKPWAIANPYGFPKIGLMTTPSFGAE